MATADPSGFDPAVEGEIAGRVRSEWVLAWTRFRRNKAALVGGIVLIVIALAAIFADVITPYSLRDYDSTMAGFLAPPGSPGHLLGTDDVGRDVFTRVIHAARISLRIGLVAVLIGSVGGTFVGLLAGFVGGRTDWAISRVLDVMLAFPGVLLAIVIVSSLGPGLTNAMIALGVSAIPFYARVVRGSTLAARELVYVRAARAVGMSESRIMFRHVLPNIISPIIIMVTLGIASSIIAAAGLSFLGLGAVPAHPRVGPGTGPRTPPPPGRPLDRHFSRDRHLRYRDVHQPPRRRPPRGPRPSGLILGQVTPSLNRKYL